MHFHLLVGFAGVATAFALNGQLPMTNGVERFVFKNLEMTATNYYFTIDPWEKKAEIANQHTIQQTEGGSVSVYNLMSFTNGTVDSRTDIYDPTLETLLFENYAQKNIARKSKSVPSVTEVVVNPTGVFSFSSGTDGQIICNVRPPPTAGSPLTIDATPMGFYFYNNRLVRRYNPVAPVALFQFAANHFNKQSLISGQSTTESGILIDAQTGDLVAMAGLTTYNRGRVSTFTGFSIELDHFETFEKLTEKQQKLLKVPTELRAICKA